MSAAIEGVHGWVDGRAIAAAWERIFGPPGSRERRWHRSLEPAIVAQRVRTCDWQGKAYYADASVRADVSEPSADSDLIRTVLALERAVARAGGAVPPQAVAAVIKTEPELSYATRPRQVGNRLAILAASRRVRQVRAPIDGKVGGHSRWYYTTLDGPRRIGDRTERVVDRRLRAISAYWRLNQGRPFTTNAISRFAVSQADFAIVGDPPYGWTSALQCFEQSGIVTRIITAREPSTRTRPHVLWVLASEWATLSDAQRAERARDPCGRDEQRSLGGTTASDGSAAAQPSQVDSARASRNTDMRVLVREALAARTLGASSQADADALAAQPIAVADVASIASRYPQLLPRGTTLASALSEACRVRHDMRCAALVRVGCVRRSAYYALNDSAAARAYVAYRSVVLDGEATAHRLARATRDLITAKALSDTRYIPLPSALLLERARRLQAEAACTASRITQAIDAAPLTSAERNEVEELLRDIHRLATERAVADPRPMGAKRRAAYNRDQVIELPAAMRIGVAAAYESVVGLAPRALRHPGQLIARFATSIRVERPSPKSTKGRRGRPAVNVIDRPAFCAYALGRWGGPRWSAFVAQAVHALGTLRDSAAVEAALTEREPINADGALCAALGLLDDTPARDALASYLLASAKDPCGFPAAFAAAFGLARKPICGFASVLRSNEREALTVAASATPDATARAVATRVLRSWDEKWDRDRLLML